VLYLFLLAGAAFGGWVSYAPEPKDDAITPPHAELVALFTNETFSEETRPEAQATRSEQEDTGGAKACDVQVDFLCWDALFRGIVEDEGIPAAFERLRNDYRTNSYVRAQCHPLAHVIGRAAVKKYPTVAEAYSKGDSFCWSGYYHGVLEGVLSGIGVGAVTEEIDTVCADVRESRMYSFDHYNCVHGLGHGVMALTNSELFEALDLCDEIGFMIYELYKTRIQLLSLAVRKSDLRKGIGTLMVRKLISKLSPLRRTRIATEVRESNLGAQIFFRSHGFRATAVIRDFYEDTQEDAYFMRYTIQVPEAVDG